VQVVLEIVQVAVILVAIHGFFQQLRYWLKEVMVLHKIVLPQEPVVQRQLVWALQSTLVAMGVQAEAMVVVEVPVVVVVAQGQLAQEMPVVMDPPQADFA